MRLYSTYKAYISRTNKVILNCIAGGLAALSILLAKDESVILVSYAVFTMLYVAVAGIMDFFQFGGVLSKKGNIPESILCAFKGKELLTKAVISDRLAHLIRLLVIVLPTIVLSGNYTAGRILLGLASWLGAFLALTIMQLVTRVMCVTFQVSMLIAYLIMIPLACLLIIPSVAFMFSEGDLTFFMAVVTVVFLLLSVVFSIIHAVLAGSTYAYKLADIH